MFHTISNRALCIVGFEMCYWIYIQNAHHSLQVWNCQGLADLLPLLRFFLDFALYIIDLIVLFYFMYALCFIVFYSNLLFFLILFY
jgi:hypothetical protein